MPPGFEVQLVAAEPDLQKPFNLAFDAAGRVWVTGSALYPWPARRDALGQPIASFDKNWDDNRLAFRASSTPPKPAEEAIDTVRVLSDFDPATGRARKVVTFADGLNIPIGILPLPRAPGAKGDTALVFSIPAIWRLTDADGDGRADVREKLYDGFGFKDTHGMSSSYWLWFDGWVYGTHGFANASEVVDRTGRVVKLTSGNTYRFRPDGSRFELYVNGQTNPFGLAFDPRGELYTADSHSKPVYLVLPGGYYEGINREHDGLGFAPAITTDDHGSSAIAGIAHYSASQFPAEYRDNLFNGNPVTRRINRARLDWRGSTPQAVRQPDFLTSDDPAFRPVQVKLGPDGALWIADFYNPIIGHYEAPLTHPARDRTHGRIWRVVWRGLDRQVSAPGLPDLTQLSTHALVPHFSDPNLVVRSLAVSELLTRPDAAAAGAAVQAAAAHLIAGTDPAADATAALPLFLTLERLGRLDEGLLRRALERLDSDVALAAVRTLTVRGKLTPADRALFADLPSRTTNHRLWRACATLFTTHPQPWGGDILLSLLLAAPEADTELVYALRLALKAHLSPVSTPDISTLLDSAPKASRATAERLIAEILLAVPTPASAEFLLGYLERTQFAAARAGDLARHAVLQLPAERFAEVLPLLRSLARAPLAQRITLAEGLASVATQAKRTLPAEVQTWLHNNLLAALRGKDAALALRAINAAKPLDFPEKVEPFRRIALDADIRESNRIAALRALAADNLENMPLFISVLGSSGSNLLRRAAADQLGAATPSPAALDALSSAYASASADLALGLTLALAQSDAGTSRLLDLAGSGRVRPQLLRHRHVELALQKRPAALRERVVTLTRALPDEDARLDAVIAQRLGVAAAFKTDLARGAAVFATQCATCHRFRDTGGNLGPSLDGSEARTVARLVEDILDPSRNIDPGFRLTTVTLKSGETKSGFNLREQDNRLLLTDPATGHDITLPRADIAETAPSQVSPMPPAFETTLSPQEFFDVIAYLRSPR
ncbi:MAG: c-type cytochrome [Verrucomicrobiota bacterium]